ncbi:hypothetical protein V6Z12_D06G083500 [Gossypium hirsutum]
MRITNRVKQKQIYLLLQRQLHESHRKDSSQMPGTIQVSVLDFKGLHSSSSSSSSKVSIKVSKGKIEYQTWDKGEFSFPLTTLRDNLIITIQDAEGNEISHTGLETRLVVEKGVWDDIFHLEGGGHVHMKLQFFLNEEERQRIRIMRESALKKKHEELCNSGHGSPKNASVSFSEASQLSVPLNNPKDAKFDIDNRDRSYSIQKQKSTDSVPSELEKRNNSKKPRPAEKGHSNVKNMINAFEGSLYQDVRPSIKPPPKISQTRKIGANSFLVNSHLNEAETEKIKPPKVTLGTINREKVQTFGSVEPIYGAAPSKESEQLKDKFKVKQRESVVKEEKKYSKDFKRASITEKGEFSQRILDKYSKGNQSWNLFSAKQYSRRKSVTKEGREENFQKDPREAEGTSNGKRKSVAIWSNHHCSIGSSGLWIFPGEAKCSCITTGAKQTMDQMGGFCDEANTHQINLSSCDPKSTGEANDADAGTAVVENEDGKTSEKLGRRVETSMNPEESIGPFGKVIKVVVMAGFATLVLLTRTYRHSCFV